MLSGDGILKRQTFVLQNNDSQRKFTALNNNSKRAEETRFDTRFSKRTKRTKNVLAFCVCVGSVPLSCTVDREGRGGGLFQILKHHFHFKLVFVQNSKQVQWNFKSLLCV